MKTSRDEIINTSVRLFAERGFDAVSTSMIAAELGITKGALYRHFDSKQAIFDSIIDKMFALDAARAEEDQVPAQTLDENPNSYRNIKLINFCEFVINQFDFWTTHEFASCFRKMITLEQFKNEQMQKLYRDVVTQGPVDYSEDIFKEMISADHLNDDAKTFGARNLAIQLYAPLMLSIQMHDSGADHALLKYNLEIITSEFSHRWLKQEK